MNKILYTIILHLLFIGAIIFGVSQCNRANQSEKTLSSKESIINKANEIVEVMVDADSNKITKSKPSEVLLPEGAIEAKHLLDSVSEPLKLTKNEKITSYTRIPIESSIKLKAKEVTSEYAYTENENWYSSYNFKDSVFDLKYKTEYTNITTKKNNKFLGIQYKPVTSIQYDWIKDKNSEVLKPTTVIIKEDKKSKLDVNFNNVNKYRSMDNAVLSGAELEFERNRLIIGGQYLYNFNTPEQKKTEWEVSLKYKIF